VHLIDSSSLKVVVVYVRGNNILFQDLAKALLYLGALLYTMERDVANGESI
jgi:hypothetical protein